MNWIEHNFINNQLVTPKNFPISIWVCADIAFIDEPIKAWSTSIYFAHQERVIFYKSPTKEEAKKKAEEFLVKLKFDLETVI